MAGFSKDAEVGTSVMKGNKHQCSTCAGRLLLAFILFLVVAVAVVAVVVSKYNMSRRTVLHLAFLTWHSVMLPFMSAMLPFLSAMLPILSVMLPSCAPCCPSNIHTVKCLF